MVLVHVEWRYNGGDADGSASRRAGFAMRPVVVRVFLVALCLGSVGWSALVAGATGKTKQVQLSGTLEVLQEDDFDSGTTRRIHLLHEASTGKTYRIVFHDMPAVALLSGTSATLRGHLLDGDTVEVRDGAGIRVGPSPRASTDGKRKALVMVVDFLNEPVGCANKIVRDKMFTGNDSVDGLYRETSFGALSFPPDTDGDGLPDVVRVSISATRKEKCNYDAWATDADAAAQSAGFDLGLYDHRVYVLPSAANCNWAGLADVGCGASCRAWIKFCEYQDIYAHELGHNLNLLHAATDSDNDGLIDCEYCDVSDFMGYAGIGWRQTNGVHKFQKGWLPPSQIADVIPGAAQVHVLSPLELDPATAAYPQLLRMPAPGGDYYYLSYRRKIGYDADLIDEYADRTAVHASSADGTGNSRLIVSLADSGRFTDPAGLQVTQISHDTTSVTLLVENTGMVCIDGDGDGYGSPGSAACPAGPAADCHDGDPSLNPGAAEACNGVDDDCDGQTDEPHLGSLPDGTLFAVVCTQVHQRGGSTLATGGSQRF